MFLNTQDIENVFITAIEGGSNYWYFLDDDSIKAIRDKVSHKENPYLAEAFARAVELGAEVPVYDIENNDELLGTMSKDSISKGLKTAIEAQRHEIFAVMKGDYDAGDADVLFQYMLLGEIVYG